MPPMKIKPIPVTPPTSDFPSDVLKWMRINNLKPAQALKFMQICQYFRHETFPYTPVINLSGHTSALEEEQFPRWSYKPVGMTMSFYVNSFSKPLWILDSLHLTKYDKLPEIVECNLNKLGLTQVDMTLKEFKFLVAPGKVTEVNLYDSVIRDENGDVVTFEALFEYLPNINSHKFPNSVFSYSENTKNGGLNNTPEEPYNIEECFTFFQKNQHIFFNFSIYGTKNDEFNGRLQKATDELLKAWSPTNKPPDIFFQAQTSKSKLALKRLVKAFKIQLETGMESSSENYALGCEETVNRAVRAAST